MAISVQKSRFPFLFGAQYYRAPTPEPDCWEKDFARMQALGFNAVKFWVQWRWSHREPDSFYFADLDRLMLLAAQHQLGVTLNVIFDVAPTWLYQEFPDAKQRNIHNQVIEPYAVGHRQIGGHPGPCYNHPGARTLREQFFEASIRHFRTSPALQMWDVWNEPELCFPSRQPNLETLVCYCPYCAEAFHSWLRNKYQNLDQLNQVWGRCYRFWEEIELPRHTSTVIDFIDWREFHLDTLAQEAQWRFEMVKSLDPAHGRYLHIVPNTWFSAVSAADDFAMAKHSEAFGGTMIGDKPASGMHVTSAADGRICYNAESHVNFGSTNMHQREIGITQLCKEFLPQIGMGVKGFLFWQYRSEVLGVESPAWGLVNLDGSDRSVTTAAQTFWSKLQPFASQLLEANQQKPTIALWRSRKNEIFHFCIRGEVNTFNQGLEAWIDALYSRNLPFHLINDQKLSQNDLNGIQLLILPMPYFMTQDEVDTVKQWVAEGGCLITEAHLAAYNSSTGRHSRTVPGGGLDKQFGFSETFSTAVRHFSTIDSETESLESLPPDVQKALRSQGAGGSDVFPLSFSDGQIVLGAQRYAELTGTNLEPLAGRPGKNPCIIHQAVENGQVFYIGTHFGEAALHDSSGMHTILQLAVRAAKIKALAATQSGFSEVHCDVLFIEEKPAFLMINHQGEQTIQMRLELCGKWQGIFTQHVLDFSASRSIEIPAGWCDLMVPVK